MKIIYLLYIVSKKIAKIRAAVAAEKKHKHTHCNYYYFNESTTEQQLKESSSERKARETTTANESDVCLFFCQAETQEVSTRRSLLKVILEVIFQQNVNVNGSSIFLRLSITTICMYY